MAKNHDELIKRLDAMFEHEGVPYGRAYLLFDREDEHVNAAIQYKGYLVLSDAFKCFFLETVELLNTECRPKIKAPLSEFYARFVPRLTGSFQSLCGAERVAIRGYPYSGYTLLRNIYDNLVLASAALQKFVDFNSIDGVEPGKPFNLDAARKLRKSTERTVRRKMTGDQSGLSRQTLSELAQWDTLFDYETHGARLSLTQSMGWREGTQPLAVLPRFDKSAFAMFMNRFCEVGWMTHRLIPLVQPPGVFLPDVWREKWLVIDESFEVFVDSLTKQCGKNIGAAIVEFVKVKFPFNEQSVFTL
ncbi:MAG: hypothetical protein A3F68_11810 [Acidobacteria bacterium RIFCSPLOWO2_12_FULL_54_10]|nr:MAG: hypothetical protein A3F68_11810 [Acidobacteria bacterium RIFCSPLOWO2_12_FULL_54_10]